MTFASLFFIYSAEIEMCFSQCISVCMYTFDVLHGSTMFAAIEPFSIILNIKKNSCLSLKSFVPNLCYLFYTRWRMITVTICPAFLAIILSHLPSTFSNKFRKISIKK